MTEQEIIEGLPLIAGFMDFKATPTGFGRDYKVSMNGKVLVSRYRLPDEVEESNAHKYFLELYCNTKNTGHFKFHTSLDWLMPVVEKAKSAAEELWQSKEEVEPLKLNIDIWDNEVKWIDTETGWYPFQNYSEKDGTIIENVWNALVAFIQWYNQNKTS